MPKPENLKGKGFKERPENINRKGRPPRLVTSIVNDLKQAGYERVASGTVIEAFEYLMNLPEEKLKEIIENKENPLSIRIVARAMTSQKGWEVLEAMFDRAHGKAKQTETIEHTGKIITGFEFKDV